MWFYYLMALRNLIRFSTRPEFEEDRKQMEAMSNQFNEDMKNWTPQTTERLHAAGYRFVVRLGILALSVFLIGWLWLFAITSYEERGLVEQQQASGSGSCLLEQNWDKIQCMDWRPGGVYHHLITENKR
jgi:hypothetical protein